MTTNTLYIKTIVFNFVFFVALIFFRLKQQHFFLNITTSITNPLPLSNPTAKDKIKHLARKFMPDITEDELQFVSAEYLRALAGGIPVYGLVNDGVVYVEDKLGMVYEAVARHELFHRVFSHYMKNADRAKLLRSYELTYGKPVTDFSSFEEDLATRFEEFRTSKFKPLAYLHKFFTKIAGMIGFITKHEAAIRNLFFEIELGTFTKRNTEENSEGWEHFDSNRYYSGDLRKDFGSVENAEKFYRGVKALYAVFGEGVYTYDEDTKEFERHDIMCGAISPGIMGRVIHNFLSTEDIFVVNNNEYKFQLPEDVRVGANYEDANDLLNNSFDNKWKALIYDIYNFYQDVITNLGEDKAKSILNKVLESEIYGYKATEVFSGFEVKQQEDEDTIEEGSEPIMPEEGITEEDITEESTGIKAHTKEKDRINHEQLSTTANVKSFLSSTFVIPSGKRGILIDPRLAYYTMLQLLSGVDLHTNFKHNTYEEILQEIKRIEKAPNNPLVNIKGKEIPTTYEDFEELSGFGYNFNYGYIAQQILQNAMTHGNNIITHTLARKFLHYLGQALNEMPIKQYYETAKIPKDEYEIVWLTTDTCFVTNKDFYDAPDEKGLKKKKEGFRLYLTEDGYAKTKSQYTQEELKGLNFYLLDKSTPIGIALDRLITLIAKDLKIEETDELYTLLVRTHERAYAQNLIAEMHNTFISQREKHFMVLEKTVGYGDFTFDYFPAQVLTVQQALRSSMINFVEAQTKENHFDTLQKALIMTFGTVNTRESDADKETILANSVRNRLVAILKLMEKDFSPIYNKAYRDKKPMTDREKVRWWKQRWQEYRDKAKADREQLNKEKKHEVQLRTLPEDYGKVNGVSVELTEFVDFEDLMFVYNEKDARKIRRYASTNMREFLFAINPEREKQHQYILVAESMIPALMRLYGIGSTDFSQLSSEELRHTFGFGTGIFRALVHAASKNQYVEEKNTNIDEETLSEEGSRNVVSSLERVLNDNKSRLNQLSRIAATSSDLSKATTVKGADGKPKYLFSPSSFANDIADLLTEMGTHNRSIDANTLFKPDYFQDPFYKLNPFLEDGVLGYVEHDKTKFGDKQTEYSRETPKEYWEREFIGAFLHRLLGADKIKKYIEYINPIEDRPNTVGFEFEIIQRNERGLSDRYVAILKQLSVRPNKEDVNGYKRKSLTNLSVLKAIIENKTKYNAEMQSIIEKFENNSENVFGQLTDIEYKKLAELFIDEVEGLADETLREMIKAKPNFDIEMGDKFEKLHYKWAKDKIINFNFENDYTYETLQKDEKEALLNLIKLWQTNSYANSYLINQLVMGDVAYFKNSFDRIKRAGGGYAPGMRGVSGRAFGINPHYKAVVVSDETLHMYENELFQSIKDYMDKAGEFERTDGGLLMLPEGLEIMQKSFGESAQLKSLIKTAYYAVSGKEDTRSVGTSMMIKSNTTVLTDEVVANNPALQKVRENMRKLGVLEFIYPSSIKVGNLKSAVSPDVMRKNLTNEEILSILENSVLTLNRRYLKVQLNPVHVTEERITNWSQLPYFMNILEETTGESRAIYESMAKLLNVRLENIDFETEEAVREQLLQAAKSADDFKQFLLGGVDFNLPIMTNRALNYLVSSFSKQTTQFKFSGSKMVIVPESNFVNPNTGKRLMVKRRADGKLVYECLMPSFMKQYVKEGDLIGVRIPTTEIHSATPFEIVGFFDESDTNAIVVPAELLKVTGADLDVDSIFVIRRERSVIPVKGITSQQDRLTAAVVKYGRKVKPIFDSIGDAAISKIISHKLFAESNINEDDFFKAYRNKLQKYPYTSKFEAAAITFVELKMQQSEFENSNYYDLLEETMLDLVVGVSAIYSMSNNTESGLDVEELQTVVRDVIIGKKYLQLAKQHNKINEALAKFVEKKDVNAVDDLLTKVDSIEATMEELESVLLEIDDIAALMNTPNNALIPAGYNDSMEFSEERLENIRLNYEIANNKKTKAMWAREYEAALKNKIIENYLSAIQKEKSNDRMLSPISVGAFNAKGENFNTDSLYAEGSVNRHFQDLLLRKNNNTTMSNTNKITGKELETLINNKEIEFIDINGKPC